MYRTVVTICTAQWSLYVPPVVTICTASGHYMYRTVVTICTASLTFSNSTFCPHSVFVCFVWISEQTAIISLYSINLLVFITETECVYCAIWTGYLNIIQISLSPYLLEDVGGNGGIILLISSSSLDGRDPLYRPFSSINPRHRALIGVGRRLGWV
jgi:hypothetical protein